MKKFLRALSAVALTAVLAISGCNIKDGEQTPSGGQTTDGIDYKLSEAEGFDGQNLTNISRWEQVPLVSGEILESGNSGGEGGQWPLCLTGGGEDGSLMFYGTNVGGLFRSVDGGKSWHKSMKDMLAHGVCEVEIDPNNPNRVVCFGIDSSRASYTTGIYLSTDMGESWNFTTHFPIGGGKDTAENLAYDPSSYSDKIGGSAVLYLSLIEKNDVLEPNLLTDQTRGLYKSNDGGVSWTRINAELGDGIVKVAANGTVFVGTENGLYESKNGGESFTQILPYNVTGLDVIGDTAYVLTDYKDGDNSEIKIWKAERDGLSQVSELTGDNVNLINLDWQKFYVNAGNDKQFLYHFSPSVHKVYTLKVSPADPDRMIMAYCSTAAPNEYYTFNSMYSSDGGKSWHSSVRNEERENLKIDDNNFLPYNVRKMDFYWSPTNPDKVWDFENDFVSSSTDGGNTFLWNSNGINGLCIGGVFGINIFDSNLIYSSAQDYNGAFSTDGGKTWKYANASGEKWGGHLYGGYPASKDVIFGAHAGGWTTDRYLAISFDGGQTFERHYGDPNYKLSAGFENRLNGQANFVSYQAFNDKNVLFCGDLRSPDMGKTWGRMKGVTGVYAHDNKDGTLYGVDDNARSVVYSKDDGRTWQTLVTSTDMNKYWDRMYISDLAVDSQNKTVYAAADWAKLYKIDVKTAEVEDITENIPLGFQKAGMPTKEQIEIYGRYFPRRITTVAVDPNYPQIVYAGGASYGYQSDSSLFRSCDGGKTFYTLTSNSTTSIVKYGAQGGYEVTCVRVNSQGDVWAAGGCLGFSKLNAPYETDKTRAVPTHKLTIKPCNGEADYGYLVHDNRTAIISDPVREGYTFDGWYSDENYSKRYGGEPVTADITLYAKWKKA